MINVDSPELLASGHKYRKELLLMPFLQLADYTQHMTRRIGVRGKETVGEYSNNAELRPYRTAKDAKDTGKIIVRTLETYMGDVVEEFDPFVISKTIWGNNLGTAPEGFDIVKATALFMSKSVGASLRKNLFKATRNAAGDSTADLFDGFSTIINKEITAGNLAEAKGNLLGVEAITSINAGDVLKALWRGATETLREEEIVKCFMPMDVYDAYNDWLLAEIGSVAYNKQFEQSTLIGTGNRCQLIPIAAMSGTEHVIMTTQKNMLVGCDQIGDEEKVEIRRGDNPKTVQFFMKAFFGVEFESISSERLMVGKIAKAQS